MSIAISAHVKPSRFFLLCISAMAFLFFFTGLVIWTDYGRNFGTHAKLVISATSFICAIFLIFLYFQSKKNVRIDISGSGQIRIREYTGNASASVFFRETTDEDAEAFHMVNGSTIWPCLLLLHLESASKRKVFLRIFPDSVSKAEFKALYIACQWLAIYQNEKQ